MSETKHTPGPWSWSRYDFRDGFHGLYSGDTPVIYPQHENHGDDGDAWFSTDEDYYGETALREADAHLIAAAPDLLEALQELLPLWSSGIDEPWVQRAHEAIAKATGEVAA